MRPYPRCRSSIIEHELRNGFLPQGYELTEDDVGRQLGYNGWGKMLPVDIGKRVWRKPHGLVMENCEQRDRRKASQ